MEWLDEIVQRRQFMCWAMKSNESMINLSLPIHHQRVIPSSSCRWRFYPRVLKDVSKVDMSTTLLGEKVSMPVCVAATAMQRMAHPEGETATARGETCSYRTFHPEWCNTVIHHLVELQLCVRQDVTAGASPLQYTKHRWIVHTLNSV